MKSLIIAATTTIIIVASLSVPTPGERAHTEPSEEHMQKTHQRVQYLNFEPLYIEVSNKESLTNYKKSL